MFVSPAHLSFVLACILEEINSNLPKSFLTEVMNFSLFPIVTRPKLFIDCSVRIISGCKVFPSISSSSNFWAISSLKISFAHRFTPSISYSNKMEKKEACTYMTNEVAVWGRTVFAKTLQISEIKAGINLKDLPPLMQNLSSHLLILQNL